MKFNLTVHCSVGGVEATALNGAVRDEVHGQEVTGRDEGGRYYISTECANQWITSTVTIIDLEMGKMHVYRVFCVGNYAAF